MVSHAPILIRKQPTWIQRATAGRYLTEGGAGAFDIGLGARYDRYDATGQGEANSVHDQISPRFRVAWRPDDAFDAIYRIRRGFPPSRQPF